MRTGLYRRQRSREEAWKVMESINAVLPDDAIKEMGVMDNMDYNEHLLVIIRIPIGEEIPEQ